MNGFALLAVHRAQAAGAGVAAADDDYALVLGRDELGVRNFVAFAALILERKKIHRVVDAFEFPARNGQVARSRGAAAEHSGIELLAQVFDRHVDADVGGGTKLDAAFPHDGETPLEEFLLHLEFGDAVTQQAPDAVSALVNSNPMPGAVELIGGGKARRPGAHNGDFLARSRRRLLRLDPTFIEGAVDDGDFDLFDRNGVVIDAEHAGASARRRTKPSGKFGEVIGGMQAHDGVAPAVAVDQVVPIRDQVAERAALVAERDAAIHAARGLLLELGLGGVLVDLVPVAQALLERAIMRLLILNFDEAGDLTHGSPPSPRPPMECLPAERAS